MALVLGACSTSGAPAATAPGNAPSTAQSNQVSTSTAGAPPNAASAGLADACALLTKAEVEAAFGESMLDGDATCTWMHEAGGLDLTVQISSQPSTPATIKALATGNGSVGVAGVGDAAVESAGLLEFVKGTTLVVIGTGDGPGIITDTTFQDLAKLVAGRI